MERGIDGTTPRQHYVAEIFGFAASSTFKCYPFGLQRTRKWDSTGNCIFSTSNPQLRFKEPKYHVIETIRPLRRYVGGVGSRVR